MDFTELKYNVADLVAALNQTLEFAYPSVVVVGELSSFRVSKNKWLYFDLKDDLATMKFFGTVFMLPGPLEDGMLLEVRAVPRFHPQFGFSMNVQSIRPVGEGTLRRAAELLQAKLTAEGLFDPNRKRLLPYPPQRIGLITSAQSAAYADFIKILGARWGGLDIQLADVQVQGEVSPAQITEAITYFNGHAEPVDVLVIIRGGGSLEDLAAFSTEQITRAVAGSRIPTLVAIGHEIDLSLAELAADVQASTPSNAAELLVPDRAELLHQYQDQHAWLGAAIETALSDYQILLSDQVENLNSQITDQIERRQTALKAQQALLSILSPQAAIKRGYALVRTKQGKIIKTVADAKRANLVGLSLSDGTVDAVVKSD